jgi:hypothetical protein
MLCRLLTKIQVIVVDDSLSMKPHEAEVESMVDLLGWTLKDFDPDKIEMRLAVANERIESNNSSDLVESLGKSNFQATCNMSHCLGELFEDYKKKIGIHGQGYYTRPMNIYILTNGIWQTPCEVEEQITDFVKFLEEHRLNRRQVGIQFIRYGENQLGMGRLHNLDTLKQRGLVRRFAFLVPGPHIEVQCANNVLCRDIVDEEYWKGDFLKILLGSINPLFDDDDDEDVHSNGNGNIHGHQIESPMSNRFT